MFPKRLYHPTKPDFLCPSQEFLDSLDDGSEYEVIPFTGPRALSNAKKQAPCVACAQYKLQIVELELELEQAKAKKTTKKG